MGKKVKVGKQRRDKAYWSAKELGFRSRASFKLVQLNRKHEFLQKSRVCIDLCAAPGSWMQVAKEHMPMSSLIVGVDLVPIKPIPGCIAIQGDITTDKCRSDLKKELQTWKADLVLHDGAPNVGKNWLHDAYQQSLLTLHSFKLATEFLMKNGTFVTKVFRSKDYQSLMWVFNQFFRKVHATKPAASRNESAEIFVVCMGYKAPDKIDPKFLDPRHVFSEVEGEFAALNAKENELVNPEKKKKAPAEGYETGTTLLFKVAKASEFIMGDKPIHVLNNCHQIVLDEGRIRKHEKTTQEVVECCKDIRVLGMKELRLLKKWREFLKKQFEEEDKPAENGEDKEEEKEVGSDQEEEEDMQKLDQEIATLKDEERRADKRLKKKSMKEKKRLADRINLKMVIPGDEGPVLEEEGLFKMADLKNQKDLDTIADQEPDMGASSDEDSDDGEQRKPKVTRYGKENGKLDKSGLYYKSDEESEDDEEDDDDDSGKEDLGLEEEEEEEEESDDEEMEEYEETNPLLVDMEPKDNKVSKKEIKASMWFDKDIFQGIEEDEDLEEADVKGAIDAITSKGGNIVIKEQKKKNAKKDIIEEKEDNSDDDSDSDSDSEYDFDQVQVDAAKKGKKKAAEKDGFEVVPKEKGNGKKRIILSPEELALGQEMIRSKKARRDIIDKGWNRYMFDDRDCDLPSWFVQEEEYHMRLRPEVDPETVEFYKNRQKDVNVKTIKKVVEAKARKKRKLAKRMERAKKRAATILDNADIGTREKASEIQKLYKKAAAGMKKKEVAYVVAKKHTAAKRAKRPANVKGPYKQVDPRMKKDTQNKRNKATGKRNQKRRLKGKKTRPQKSDA